MRALLTIIFLALVQATSAVLTYHEACDGDLGDNYLTPQIFRHEVGDSTLTGTVSPGDVDIFTLEIAAGRTLEAIYLLDYESDSLIPGNISFLLSQPGATLSAPPSDEDPYPGGAIGYVGFGEWAEGREILRFLTVGPPYDYARTLGEGSYAFWINETGPTSHYQFQFRVVPEPSFAFLLFPPLLWSLSRRKR